MALLEMSARMLTFHVWVLVTVFKIPESPENNKPPSTPPTCSISRQNKKPIGPLWMRQAGGSSNYLLSLVLKALPVFQLCSLSCCPNECVNTRLLKASIGWHSNSWLCWFNNVTRVTNFVFIVEQIHFDESLLAFKIILTIKDDKAARQTYWK